jgi:hypothetical protein
MEQNNGSPQRNLSPASPQQAQAQMAAQPPVGQDGTQEFAEPIQAQSGLHAASPSAHQNMPQGPAPMNVPSADGAPAAYSRFNGQEEVVAVRKNGDGDIVELKLTSGRVVDYKTAQAMVKNNEIKNLNVFRGRDGDEHLRSNPDGRKDNNLDNLPTF